MLLKFLFDFPQPMRILIVAVSLYCTCFSVPSTVAPRTVVADFEGRPLVAVIEQIVEVYSKCAPHSSILRAFLGAFLGHP